MTKEKIKNTPELVDFMLDESVIADSREKLRKRLEEICNLAIKALEQEPKPKIAYWARDGITYKGWPRYVCSECKRETRHGKSKYCPNCGTKMIEQEEHVMFYPQVPGITPTVVEPQESEG